MKECVLEINANHLKQNFQWYKSQSHGGFICPMVKANAYGAGDLEVFSVLRSAGATTFGVVRLSEAKKIRAIDDSVQILLFNPCDIQDYHQVVQLKLTPVISNIQALLDFEFVLHELNIKSYDVHLEFDTGMNRLGFKNSDLDEVFKHLEMCQRVKVAGFFSHFVQAEDWPSIEGRTLIQLQAFKSIDEKFEHFLKLNPELKSAKQYVKHLSSSKAFNDQGMKSEHQKLLSAYGLRPGLGLYGISQNNQNLKPVLTLKAPIVDVKWCQPGETVSYDGVWKAHRKSLIGTLPLGYGDGYPRALMGQSFVIIDGKKAPVVGKVCMDFIMVDLTDLVTLPDGGDLSSLLASDLKKTHLESLAADWKLKEALVFGDQSLDRDLSIESLAAKAGLITYEFIVRLSARLNRRIVEL